MIRSSVSLFFAFAVLAFGEPADWLFTARYVVTMDAQHRILDNGAVAVRGERIVAVGSVSEVTARFQPKQRVDAPDGILIPGLINTHTHAPMTLLRGIADDVRLQDWLTKYIFPAEARNVSPDFVRWGTRLACAEMLLSGTTTYVDMYYFEDVIAEATKECGMRGVLGETIIRFPVPDAKTPQQGLERAESFIKRFHNDPLITPAVAPHAVYTNDDATLQACRKLADRYGVPLVIHLSETKRENDELTAQRGVTPAALLDRLGVLSGPTIAAHGVWLDTADTAILKRRGTGVAHCPSSNMMLGSGVAPVLKLLAAGVATGLGTDGPAGSNNDLNMFEEMDLAAKLQKITTLDPRALTAEQAFTMATIGGARAIGMQKEIGSIETGKRADMAVVSLHEANAVPLYGVFSQLVYALKGSDVRHVMVNGRLVVRDRKLLTIDLPAVLAKAEQYRNRVSASLSQH